MYASSASEAYEKWIKNLRDNPADDLTDWLFQAFHAGYAADRAAQPVPEEFHAWFEEFKVSKVWNGLWAAIKAAPHQSEPAMLRFLEEIAPAIFRAGQAAQREKDASMASGWLVSKGGCAEDVIGIGDAIRNQERTL